MCGYAHHGRAGVHTGAKVVTLRQTSEDEKHAWVEVRVDIDRQDQREDLTLRVNEVVAVALARHILIETDFNVEQADGLKELILKLCPHDDA